MSRVRDRGNLFYIIFHRVIHGVLHKTRGHSTTFFIDSLNIIVPLSEARERKDLNCFVL